MCWINFFEGGYWFCWSGLVIFIFKGVCIIGVCFSELISDFSCLEWCLGVFMVVFNIEGLVVGGCLWFRSWFVLESYGGSESERCG